jgi:hypothetical protein
LLLSVDRLICGRVNAIREGGEHVTTRRIALGLAALACIATAAALAQTQDAGKQPPTSNQLLMRDKVSYANKALEGLAVEDFNKISESAKYLGMISRAASWHVLPTGEYARFSKDFQEQASDLERHAKDKNLDAASLDYMRITLTCVQCHKYIRETRAKQGK